MSGLTGARAVTVLKLLAGGRDLDTTALMASESLSAVSTLAEHHGWPDREQVRAAIRSFEDQPLAVPRVTPVRRSLELSPRLSPPTEFTGTKQCARCGEAKPFTEFWADRKNADRLYGTCKDCERDSDAARPVTVSRVIYQRAYKRAQARLRDAHPDEFAALLHGELAVTAAETPPAESADPHHPLPLLQPGKPRRGQGRADRVRADDPGCRACSRLHDAGHECPECGWRPDEQTPGIAS